MPAECRRRGPAAGVADAGGGRPPAGAGGFGSYRAVAAGSTGPSRRRTGTQAQAGKPCKSRDASLSSVAAAAGPGAGGCTGPVYGPRRGPGPRAVSSSHGGTQVSVRRVQVRRCQRARRGPAACVTVTVAGSHGQGLFQWQVQVRVAVCNLSLKSRSEPSASFTLNGHCHDESAAIQVCPAV
jgi:hypothetical protein